MELKENIGCNLLDLAPGNIFMDKFPEAKETK